MSLAGFLLIVIGVATTIIIFRQCKSLIEQMRILEQIMEQASNCNSCSCLDEILMQDKAINRILKQKAKGQQPTN